MIKVAQIGCGYWGPNILRNLQGISSCEVKYVVDARAERRSYVEGQYPGVKSVESIDIVLEDSKVDAVCVCTPAASHFELAKQFLTAGKHCFVEKPLAMSVKEVDELGRLAKERNLTLMVGHTFLYNSAVRMLKGFVESGELGEIYYAYSQRLNLGVVRSDVNALWNLAPHDISILCYLFDGAPTEVVAHGTDYIQDGIEDVVFVNMEFGNKARGSVQVSWLDPNKVRRLTVVGSKKMVVYDDVADDKITIYDKGIDKLNLDEAMPFDTNPAQKLIHRAGDILIPKIKWKEPLRTEMEHFLECVSEGNVPLTGVDHARQVVEVLERADASMKGRQ